MATLERLPAELVVLIAGYVKAAEAPLAPFAATSRRCRTHIEIITFRSLRISDSEVPSFLRIVTRARFLALRNLTYDFRSIQGHWLDGPSSRSIHREWLGGHSSRISTGELAASDEAFTSSIRDLLIALQQKSSNIGAHHPGITLSLECPHRLRDTYSVSSAYIKQDDDDDETRFERAWLRLIEDRLPDDLLVPVVTEFFHQGTPFDNLYQWVWPPSWSVLLARFPKLKLVYAHVFDNERKAFESRREARNGFGTSLELLPLDMTDFRLTYLGYPPDNHFMAPHRLTHPELGYDIFSHELGVFSQRLVSLELHGATLDLLDFFQPCAQTAWPHVVTLSLDEQQAASADGTWYFDLDPRITVEEFEEEQTDPNAETLDDMRLCMGEDELPAAMDVPTLPFRSATDPTKFKEIYLAAAEAAKRMPKLQILGIRFESLGESGFGMGVHEFRYVRGQGWLPWWRTSSSAEIKVGWIMFPMIAIDKEVLQSWKDVGTAKGASIELLSRDSDLGDVEFQLVG